MHCPWRFCFFDWHTWRRAAWLFRYRRPECAPCPRCAGSGGVFQPPLFPDSRLSRRYSPWRFPGIPGSCVCRSSDIRPESGFQFPMPLRQALPWHRMRFLRIRKPSCLLRLFSEPLPGGHPRGGRAGHSLHTEGSGNPLSRRSSALPRRCL